MTSVAEPRSRNRIILLLLPVVAGIGLAWWASSRPPLHERQYAQLVREFYWNIHARILQFQTPANLAPFIPFDTIHAKLQARTDVLIKALLSNGYFTNATIPIPLLPPGETNESTIQSEVHRRMTNGSDSGYGYISYSVRGTNLNITCRTSDLPRLQSAINNP